MLDTPNHLDFQVGREAEADANLLVKFFIKEREDKKATAAEGRPMFKDVEYVEIRIAGKRDAQACRPATEADKQRFPRHYEMFKTRTEAPTTGTPLSEWPQISRSVVEELSFINIKTVEQLASVGDDNISRIHGGLTLKARAADFLEYADTTKLIAEKEQLNATIEGQAAEIAELKEAVAQLARNSTTQTPEPTQIEAPEAIEEETPAPAPKTTRRRAPAKK